MEYEKAETNKVQRTVNADGGYERKSPGGGGTWDRTLNDRKEHNIRT